jgi:hypothetical protein
MGTGMTMGWANKRDPKGIQKGEEKLKEYRNRRTEVRELFKC